MRRIATYVVLSVTGIVGIAALAVGVARADDPAQADEGAACDCPCGRGPAGWIREALDLTDDQAEQVSALHQSFREEAAPLREQLRETHRAAVDLLRAGSLSRADLLAKHQKAMSVLNQMGMMRIDMIYDMWQVLTPEQREKLGEILPEDGGPIGFGFGHGPRHGRGHGGCGGCGGHGRGPGFGPF